MNSNPYQKEDGKWYWFLVAPPTGQGDPNGNRSVDQGPYETEKHAAKHLKTMVNRAVNGKLFSKAWLHPGQK
jgi:hypothetical protein